MTKTHTENGLKLTLGKSNLTVHNDSIDVALGICHWNEGHFIAFIVKDAML